MNDFDKDLYKEIINDIPEEAFSFFRKDTPMHGFNVSYYLELQDFVNKYFINESSKRFIDNNLQNSFMVFLKSMDNIALFIEQKHNLQGENIYHFRNGTNKLGEKTIIPSQEKEMESLARNLLQNFNNFIDTYKNKLDNVITKNSELIENNKSYNKTKESSNYFIKLENEKILRINDKKIDFVTQGSFNNQIILLREIFKEEDGYVSFKDLLENSGWETGNTEKDWKKIRNTLDVINKKIKESVGIEQFLQTQNKTEIFINKKYL